MEIKMIRKEYEEDNENAASSSFSGNALVV